MTLKILSGALALLVTVAPDPRDQGPDTLDVSSYPPEYQKSYQLFAVRCSKCHSLARPINARLQGDQWKTYIKKMIRRPASGINEDAGRQIYEFLKYSTTRSQATRPPAATPEVPVAPAPDAGSP